MKMKKYLILLILLLITSFFYSFTIGRGKDCIHPAIKATINGNRAFRSCDADAHLIVSMFNIYGTSNKDIIGINFMTSLNETLPGTYVITKAGEKTKGQKFGVNFVYYLNGSTIKDRYESVSGTVTFTIADGKHFKGTFSGLAKQKESKAAVQITNGTFDLYYNPAGNVTLGKKNKK